MNERHSMDKKILTLTLNTKPVISFTTLYSRLDTELAIRAYK